MCTATFRARTEHESTGSLRQAASDTTHIDDRIARPLGLWETPASSRPRRYGTEELPSAAGGADAVRQLERGPVKKQARPARAFFRAPFERDASGHV
jgi:hypothetical protein